MSRPAFLWADWVLTFLGVGLLTVLHASNSPGSKVSPESYLLPLCICRQHQMITQNTSQAELELARLWVVSVVQQMCKACCKFSSLVPVFRCDRH